MSLSKLVIRYQNARGLRTKIDEFSGNIINSEADIHILTETWLNSDFHSSEYIMNNFTSHRRDRNYSNTKTTMGGGCWLFHKKELDVTRRYDLESDIDFVEDLWVQVNLDNSDDRLFICSVYITSMPNNAHLYIAFTDRIKDSISKLNPSDRLLIIGDFNVSDIKWRVGNDGVLTHTLSSGCNKAIDVLDMISFGNLRQHNSVFNKDNNILDLVLSSDPVRAITVVESDEYLVKVDGYHPPLEISVSEQVKYMPVVNHRKYNFRRADYDLIKMELDLTDWEFLNEMPINSAVNRFYDRLNEIIKKHTPLHKGKPHFPFWFDDELKTALKCKEKARKKFKTTNSLEDYMKFSDLRKKCKLKIDSCHTAYITHIQTNMKSNIKLFWAYSKSKRQSNSYPTQFKLENRTASSPNEICELFATFFRSTYTTPSSDRTFNINPTANPTTVNPFKITINDVKNTIQKLDLNKNGGPDGIPNFFLRQVCEQLASPLALIFNKSLSCSEFPSAFKTSISTPIYKKGDESCVSNYRQVCMANSISIVFEKIMNKYLTSLVENQLTPNQHGFIKNKSTNTNLIEYVSRVSSALDEGFEIHTIYTDFCKAFDTVDHDILLSKLQAIGLNDSLLLWLKSYLLNRLVCVSFNGHKSLPFEPSSGVPQGSVLGPLLFNIFINDISHIFENDHLLLADDLKIFRKIRSSNDIPRLQADIDKLHEWTVVNNLKLNTDKCYAMSFSNKVNPTPTNYNINGTPLVEVTKMKDLGVTFDKKLKFDDHVNSIVKKSYSMLGFVMRTASKFNDLSCVNFLYNSLVRSRLEYNTAVWNPYQSTYKSKIERVQRKYTRLLFYKLQYEPLSYTQRLQVLNMPELERRREYFDACLIHRIVHDQNMVSSNRPVIRVSRFSSRFGQMFNPLVPRTDYGLHRNPSMRTQLLYNRKYTDIDMLNLNKVQFQSVIKNRLFPN